MAEITRRRDRARIRTLLRDFPIVGVLGARQVGKSTLARQIATGREATWFDLENSEDVARLRDPLLTLREKKGLVVIDEVQRAPDLFATLRVLADERHIRRRFLVLGSASLALLQQGSETLAGRIAWHELDGLQLDDIDPGRWRRRWLRGGYPRSFLAATDGRSTE